MLVCGILSLKPMDSVQAAAPASRCNGPQYRQFDFWLGHWAVTDRLTNKLDGTNDITSELGGCVVQEHWLSGTQTGTSFNIYDATTRQWHQTWIDNSGTLLMLHGEMRDGAMVLSGVKLRPDGTRVMHTISYTPDAAGSVRQHWVASRDNGKSWKDLFDGVYRHDGFVAGVPAPMPPACTLPQYRQFDFWAGNWRVTDRKTHAFLGTNMVTHEQGGCALQEHWAGAKTSRGMSFNIYERSTKHWHQTWVDNSGGLLELTGGLQGKSMVLSQTLPDAHGKLQVQRITWTPQPDGTVRQHWETSADTGKTWQDAFDGIYTRV